MLLWKLIQTLLLILCGRRTSGGASPVVRHHLGLVHTRSWSGHHQWSGTVTNVSVDQPCRYSAIGFIGNVIECLHLQRYSQSRRPGVLLVGTSPRGRYSHQLHSQLMEASGIVPGKIMECLGTVRPVALWIALYLLYLQSHCPATGSWNDIRDRSSRRSHARLKRFSGIVPGKVMEGPGTVMRTALWIAL